MILANKKVCASDTWYVICLLQINCSCRTSLQQGSRPKYWCYNNKLEQNAFGSCLNFGQCFLFLLISSWEILSLVFAHAGVLFPVAEIDGNTYWRHPFNSLFHPRQLEEFIIMDINRVQEKKKGAGAGARSNKVRAPHYLTRCFGPSSPPPPLLSWTSLLSPSVLQSQVCALLCLAAGQKLFSGRCGQCFGLEIAQALREFHFRKSFSVEEFKFCLLLSLLKLFCISCAALQFLNCFCWKCRSIAF